MAKLFPNITDPQTRREILGAMDERMGEMKRRMQDSGYLIRMTEWHEGFQTCLFKHNDFRDCFVSNWEPNEYLAWEAALGWLVDNKKEKTETT